ncbi:MAG: discoidin domain-containing protein, partial [Nitrososphaeraceae archaeon]
MSSLFIRSALFLLIVSSFIFSQTIHSSFGAEATTSTCVDTNITGLSSSGSSQGFPPSGVVDNNFNTLWSVFGKGSWIQLDLGSSKNICSVNIAWYKGDARQNNFVISTSTDGSIYNTVLTSKSAGNTLSYEKYQIPTALARYVKITVNGNTQNNYASVTEVKAQTTTTSQPQQIQCTTTTGKSAKAS